MSEVVTAPPAPPEVRLPPAARIPKLLCGIIFASSRRGMINRLARRHGNVFTLNIPIYGRVVIVGDPQLAKQIFTTSPEELGNIQPNLSRMFGSGSVFGLDGDDHRRRRRLLAPPFHGKSMKNYEAIIEEETLRGTANWPEGRPFPTLPSMMHITLNAILRAVFGAGGAELDELRRLIPPWVTLGSRLAAMPKPERTYSRYGPWGRLAEWRRQISWVPQHPFLFAASVADNIALGHPAASREAIARAAQAAGAAEFVEQLPLGYATEVGERGLRLSSGQRQQIALARAFLRDAPLLLLDEPTAHLDAASAGRLDAVISTLMADRTVIQVTHGPSLARATGSSCNAARWSSGPRTAMVELVSVRP